MTPPQYLGSWFAVLLVLGVLVPLQHARAQPAELLASSESASASVSSTAPSLTVEQLFDLVFEPHNLAELNADNLPAVLAVGVYRAVPSRADQPDRRRAEVGKGVVRRLAASFSRDDDRALLELDLRVAHGNARALYAQAVHAAQRRHGKLVWLADTHPIARSAWCMSEEQGWVVLVARVGGELRLRVNRNETCTPAP